jgi:pentatricopeptide repeat protein
MGVTVEIFSGWAGNLVEHVFGPEIACKARKILPDLPPEPRLWNLQNAKQKDLILFRDFRFFGGATRYAASEPLWQDFESFYSAPQPLSWWLITGSAGAGKSRTAFEFCKALETGHARFFHAGKPRLLTLEPVVGENYSIWKSGFPDLDRTPFKVWETWRPRHHTLLVFDGITRHYNARLGEKLDGEDAQRNRHNIVEIIKLLSARAEKGEFQHRRIRLLLLERECGGARHQDWFNDLPRQAEVCFRQEPTPLPAVPTGGLFFSIAKDIYENARRSQSNVPRVIPWDFLDKLRTIDSEQRPLYAMLLASYLARNNNPPTVTRNDVLDYTWYKEYVRELKPVGEKKTPYILKAMAQSTLTGGRIGTCAMDDVSDLWYSGIGYENAARGAFHLYPVKPDVLGEHLVLHALEQKRVFAGASIPGDAMRAMILKAWEDFPADVSGFFERCAQNLPSDPEWLDTRFLSEQLAHSNITIRLRYMQTAANMISRFSKKQVDSARKVFDTMAHHAGRGLFRRELARAATSLVRLYVSGGMFDAAHGIFMGMNALVGNSEDARASFVEAAACLVDGFGRAGELVRARLLFEAMQTFGYSEKVQALRTDALISLISAYGRTGELGEAHALLKSMANIHRESPGQWVQRAKASVNLVILYARSGRMHEACAVFESMSVLGSEAAVRHERKRAFRFLEFFTAKQSGRGTQEPILTAVAA